MENSVQGLTKVVYISHYGHLKHFHHVLKFVVDKIYYGVYLKPDIKDNDEWNIVGYSDSYWDSYMDDRKNISVWSIFISSSIVSWGSIGQKRLDLSSTEEEYMSLDEIFK